MSERKKFKGIADAFSVLPAKTREHCERVADYMRVVYSECCFSSSLRTDQKSEARLRDDLTEMAYRMGLYHDIGKAYIPAELHFNDGGFSDEENALYRKYSDYTQKLIFDHYRNEFRCGVREETYAYETVCSMNENYDGSGHPQGLAGKKIPVVARILAAVDAFDTKATLAEDENAFETAMSYISEQSGKLLDKEVVEIMKSIKPNLLKIYRQHIPAGTKKPVVARLIPPSGKKTVTLEYRTIDGRDCTTVAIEARPKFRIGDSWTDFDGIASLFTEKQDKQFRIDMCMYLAGEACDFMRQAEALNLNYKYILVKLPAAFLRLPGAAQSLIGLLDDEEIECSKFRINAEAGLFTGGSSGLEKNIRQLTAAGIGIMMSGVTLSDGKRKDPEIVTLTAHQVAETGVTSFRIGRKDEQAADEEEGIARFQQLLDAGIEITADNLDSEEIRATLSILGVTDFTGEKHGAYTDADTLLSKETAAAAAG